MKPRTILTAGPSITKREIEYVLDAVSGGWNENWNGYLNRFERALALGATVNGQRVGGLSDVACFSFQGAKIMTTGEGGMLVTSDEALYERIKFLADHGRDRHIPFQISEVGYKYKMSNIQAALGL